MGLGWRAECYAERRGGTACGFVFRVFLIFGRWLFVHVKARWKMCLVRTNGTYKRSRLGRLARPVDEFSRKSWALSDARRFFPHRRVCPNTTNATQKQGSALSRKPRNTCGACNSGWMSRIENAVTPIAIPLILGKPCLIDTIGRWQLASVLCLISMRVAFLTKSPFVLPVEDREWMMEKAEPPPHWKIWITRIVEPPLDEHWTLFSAVALPPSHKVSSDIRILNARPLSSANFARTS